MQTDTSYAQVNAGDLFEILDVGVTVQNVEFSAEDMMAGIDANFPAVGITGFQIEVGSVESLEDSGAPDRRQFTGKVGAELPGHIPLGWR